METERAEYKIELTQLKEDLGGRMKGLEKSIARAECSMVTAIIRAERESAAWDNLQLLATAALLAGAVTFLGVLIRL